VLKETEQPTILKIGRRAFLKHSALGISGLLLGCEWENRIRTDGTFDPYEKVSLGHTGLNLSRVGLGTGMNGSNRMSNQTRLGPEKCTALIRGCYERGIRWFDAADLYGSHSYLADALKGIDRTEYVLVSKIWFGQRGLPEPERPDADVVVARFLKELRTDYIDLILLHCMTDPQWTSRYANQMEILENLKKKGIIRAHGVSCHSLEVLKAASEHPWVDSIHARINPYGVQMDAGAEQVVPVLQKAHDNGKGIIGMKIIGAGEFRNSDQRRNESIDFVFNLGCVDAVTIGFESLDEEKDFAERVRNTPVRRKA
jgi:aryl-alcohol dehydrogenase-like predicted oxidoreductase